MNIGIVAHLPDLPGPYPTSRRVGMVARGLAERGHSVSVIIPRKLTDGPMNTEYQGIRVHWLYNSGGADTIRGRIIARWRALKWITAKVRGRELDWLILYNLGIEGVPFAISAQLSRRYVSAVYGDLRYHPQKKTLADHTRLTLLELADFIIPKLSHLNIVDTRFLQDRLKRLSPRTPTLIVPPLVDPTVFHDDPANAQRIRARYGLLNGDVVIGYFGSLWFVNGVANLIKAARTLVNREKRVKLIIGGRLVKELDCDDAFTLAKEAGLEDHVVLTYFGDNDIIAAMSACDILTVPRIPHPANEAGSPTKLAEYLAVGRAVVAAAVGDIPLYLHDGVDALLVEPGNVEALTNALTLLVDDAHLRTRLAAATHETVRATFHYQKAAERIETAMFQVMQGHKR